MKNYTRIPNELIRSPDLDPYDFRVYLILLSLNPCFPSYEKLILWSGIRSRERVAKSLNKLESKGLITRQRQGRHNVYRVIHISSLGELFGDPPVRETNGYSSPDERVPVRQTNGKKTNIKRTNKKEDIDYIENETFVSLGSDTAKILESKIQGFKSKVLKTSKPRRGQQGHPGRKKKRR